MKKLFVVYVTGEHFDETFEYVYGICPTMEIAKALAEKVKQEYNVSKISPELWVEMNNALSGYEEEHEEFFIDPISGLMELFPEYSKEDLEKAELIYDFSDFKETRIEEIDFYESLNDIK